MTQSEFIASKTKTGNGFGPTGKPFEYPPPNEQAIEWWKREHRQEVKYAIANKESVPPEVIEEYSAIRMEVKTSPSTDNAKQPGVAAPSVHPQDVVKALSILQSAPQLSRDRVARRINTQAAVRLLQEYRLSSNL